MTAILYDRKSGTTFEIDADVRPAGMWGSISLSQVSAMLEALGHTAPGQRVTHLMMDGETIQYRVEPRGGKS